MCKQPSLLLILLWTHAEAGLWDPMAVLTFIFEESPHCCPWQLCHFVSPPTEHEVVRVLVMGPVSVTWSFKVVEEEGTGMRHHEGPGSFQQPLRTWSSVPLLVQAGRSSGRSGQMECTAVLPVLPPGSQETPGFLRMSASGNSLASA